MLWNNVVAFPFQSSPHLSARELRQLFRCFLLSGWGGISLLSHLLEDYSPWRFAREINGLKLFSVFFLFLRGAFSHALNLHWKLFLVCSSEVFRIWILSSRDIMRHLFVRMKRYEEVATFQIQAYRTGKKVFFNSKAFFPEWRWKMLSLQMSFFTTFNKHYATVKNRRLQFY